MADLASRITKPEGAEAETAPAQETTGTVEDAQTDGAGQILGGSGLQDVNYDVEVSLNEIQRDQQNPLGSAHTFQELGLPNEVLNGLMAMSFQKPSKVQEKALPLMLADPPMNMIAQSQSGTGKTAAFVTTILSRIDFTKPEQPQALVLAPSRELARQIQGVVQTIGQFCGNLVVEAAIPGNIARDSRVKASVVTGTPGTVMDLIRRRQFDVSQLKVLVIDEADNMLDLQGLGEQCARVKNMLPPTIQILLFSATFPDVVLRYATNFAPQANQIKLKVQELTVRGISQMFMDCPSEVEKYSILCSLYGLMNIGSSIIFVKTRESASEIQKRMEADGHKVTALHGAFEGSSRDALLDEFRQGRSKVLITTNVLARGIDVSSVSMVINYDVPMKGPGEREADPETYLHRIGRTGRFGRVGVSITFIYDKKSYEALQYIAAKYDIDLIRLVPDDWDNTEKKVQRVIKSSRAQAGFNPSART
ncbi:P-loop containing nucleoside triphosphate hydrolase protein [Pseudomassariella vexata]|uniref:RNA helicase n=1 Tax=Pseudomassariella vexata TaxID=1141098 RepID=A0A1Y2EB84_9PEZI|nr:P-loop containing nucleoside triphosphate hydrolase protein [Pseudomassariella vexata]ORY68830.1 P-loop containing nucleoside triphosphate hydrolase protein [Pseudomassariella vexata]